MKRILKTLCALMLLPSLIIALASCNDEHGDISNGGSQKRWEEEREREREQEREREREEERERQREEERERQRE